MINPLIGVLIVSIGWGIAPVFEKFALKHMEPLLTVGFFGVFFGILGLFILGGRYLKDKNIFSRGVTNYNLALSHIFLAAFFSYILGSLFFFLALDESKNTTLVILLAYTLPIIIGLIASKIILKSKINAIMYFGMLLTLLGLIITVKYKEN